MKVATTVAIASILLTGTALAGDNASSKAPGQRMQEKGSVKGTTGASGYAPGQRMQDKGSVKGTTGASGFAPGHANTRNGDANENVGASGNGASGNSSGRSQR
jgi:hypothetical protein